MKSFLKTLLLFVFVVSMPKCKSDDSSKNTVASIPKSKEQIEVPDESKTDLKTKEEIGTPAPTSTKTKGINVKDWTEITSEDGFVIDMKYAGNDNFTKRKIYDCGKCFLRPEAAKRLKDIHAFLNQKYGYRIKVFDCFRPRPYQQRLWDIVPDPNYVTPPTKGSMHSRGLAVDLTITDSGGKELDMGTDFDYFGKEAHQDYVGHTPEINKNRALLKKVMESYGFKSIRTEWWHYSYAPVSYPLDEWVWPCEVQ